VYEDFTIRGIFSSRALAQTFIDSHKGERFGFMGDDASIEEWLLDDESKWDKKWQEIQALWESTEFRKS